jgi:hypothetical protein
MPDLKEKLVELLIKGNDACVGTDCFEGCNLCFEADCLYKLMADVLIANGVTIQELDGCEYCKEYEDLPEHFVDGKPVGRVFDTCIQPDENGLWHLEVPVGADIGIRFCPMCGRRLPQPPKGE